MRPMEPAYFAIISEKVKTRDGDVEARTIQWIAAPAAGPSSVPDATRNVVMLAVDAGTTDERGAKVKLSPSSGGKENRRGAIPHIARALMNAHSTLTEPQAERLARDVLKDLRDRVGCVVEQDVQVPQYKSGGQPNGTRQRRGLVTRWDLASWAAVATVQPAPDAQLDRGAP
jgi:hypothetical protein